MNRLLVDLDEVGRASVSVVVDGELPERVGETAALEWPMSAGDLEDLRWYLEDYLRVPFSVYESRGLEIAGRLPVWGAAMFSAVFGSGPVRDAYVRLRDRADEPGALEIVVRSAVSGWLGLPWELLRDPDRPAPLALEGVGLSRSLPSAGLGRPFAVRGERLRVLMVISRPRGEKDVGYQMIARPLLDRLDAVRGRVELTVLRPPTLQGLIDTLRAAEVAGEPFQVVHFDGHGVLTGARAGGAGSGAPLSFDARSGEGVLVFEQPAGGSDEVSAARVAQVLGEARVPVVVLNACQSGAVGKELEAAVATCLLAGGACAVVAMAYSVYAVAAAEFMAAFYERLFTGETVADAVRAGRARMGYRPNRPSPKGELPLEDWAIPVHYLRQDVQFPDLRPASASGRPEVSLDAALDRIHHHGAATDVQDPLAAVGEFVGRDDLIYTLELAARTEPVIVLHGPAGTGKTEVAKAFGRWWRDTGGVTDPNWVIWHSFAPGTASFGLDGVLSTIGLTVYGERFALVDREQRREVILTLLAEHRLLVIWDNFETVATMPDTTAPEAAPDLRDELADFLARVKNEGRSVVLTTSRTREEWLEMPRRIGVGGLNHREAVQYVDHLLVSFPSATSRRNNRAFADLMEWLHGHPLSMRVVLPHLDTTDAAVIMASLDGTITEHTDSHDNVLATSITYSITHLTPDSRQLLSVVCLFAGVADVDVLGLFSDEDTAPQQFRGPDAHRWKEVLDAAAHVGLLTDLGSGMFGIHPALPAYLAAQWRTDHPDDYTTQRAAAENTLMTAYSHFSEWLYRQINAGDAALAYTVIGLQRRTMTRLLGHALKTNQWPEARDLAISLNAYWDLVGLTEEARAWVDRAQTALEDPNGTPPALDQPAGATWLLFVGVQANRQLLAGQLNAAEQTYTDILHMLQAQPESPQQRNYLSTCYHHLGLIAQERGQLDDAENWCRQSLTIKEQRNDRRGMASSYHHLGTVAEDRGDLDDAEDWHRKSLTIKEQRNDRPGMANSYHQLGMVAQRRGHLDDAEDWYRKSLSIAEQLNDRPGMASGFHHLGMVAQRRGHLDDAEDWYRKSLSIAEQLSDHPSMATSYGQLGLLVEHQGQMIDALDWVIRSVTLFNEFPHPATGPAPQHLARLTHQLGSTTLEQRWHALTNNPVPADVRAYIDTYQQQLAAEDR